MTHQQGPEFLRVASDEARRIAKDRGLYGQLRKDFIETLVYYATVRAIKAPAHDPARSPFASWVRRIVRLATWEPTRLGPRVQTVCIDDCPLERLTFQRWASIMAIAA